MHRSGSLEGGKAVRCPVRQHLRLELFGVRAMAVKLATSSRVQVVRAHFLKSAATQSGLPV